MRRRPGLAIVCAIVGVLACTSAVSDRPVVAPEGTDVGLPFSPAVWSNDLLFLSGAIGNLPGTRDVPGDVVQQTRQTVANLRQVLDAAGLDPTRVVSADIYLADLREFPSFWKTLRAELPGNLPAGAAVEGDIAIPGARLELGFVAARPGVEIRRIRPEGWLEPTNGGSWAVMAGDVLFLSGMASFDPATGQFVPGNFEAQTTRTMQNVESLLRTAGLGWQHVSRCRVFLPDPRDYVAMNAAYGAFVGDAPPARATVRARLLHPEARIGVQCLAVASRDREVVRARGSKPSGRPFSPAIRTGDRLYLSGMVGRGARGFGESIAKQTRITLDNLAATLDAAGLTFDDVAEATVYLTDIRHYDAMNEIYGAAVGKPPPARATVGMPLMSPDALVEIQMTATLPDTSAGMPNEP